jgi:hypothetical protein
MGGRGYRLFKNSATAINVPIQIPAAVSLMMYVFIKKLFMLVYIQNNLPDKQAEH